MYQQTNPIYQNSKAVRDMVLLLMASSDSGSSEEQRKSCKRKHKKPKKAKAREKKKKEKDNNDKPKKNMCPHCKKYHRRSPIASSRTNACGTKNTRDTASSQSVMSSR